MFQNKNHKTNCSENVWQVMGTNALNKNDFHNNDDVKLKNKRRDGD